MVVRHARRDRGLQSKGLPAYVRSIHGTAQPGLAAGANWVQLMSARDPKVGGGVLRHGLAHESVTGRGEN